MRGMAGMAGEVGGEGGGLKDSSMNGRPEGLNHTQDHSYGHTCSMWSMCHLLSGENLIVKGDHQY